MGFWGTGLYANDMTCDVRDTYVDYLQEGFDNTQAYENTLKKFQEIIGNVEEPFLWFALAETQWRMGRLTQYVKTKALGWIEEGGGLELWEDSKNGAVGWQKTLSNLKKKLESPIPLEKKIRKPVPIIQNLWNINDIYAYQFHREKAKEHGFFGKYMLIQKIGEGTIDFSDEIRMRIHVFDYIFDELPSLNDIAELRILPLDCPTRPSMNREPLRLSALIHMFSKREYPTKQLTFIGNKLGPINPINNRQSITWGNIDTWLYEFQLLWRGIKY